MRRRHAAVAIAALACAVGTAAPPATAAAASVPGRAVTTEGPVQGVLDAASGVWEFRGIPYAAPPTASRRFARPAPPATRDALLVADALPSACPQLAGPLADDCSGGATAGEPVGSEDCLALNVFTPAADWPPAATRPVMVYVHGGGFTGGCERGSSPALAAAGDVVLVRLQYRLGLLGFMATEAMAAEDDFGSAGNWGMLDVVRALHWVRDNAAAFGGDPENVTLFGESAGGVAVCSLLASPLADGLFERAIVESGHCQIARPLRSTPGTAIDGGSQVELGRAVAARLGCGDDGAAQLDCLRALPAEAIVGAQAGLAEIGADSIQLTLDGHFVEERPLTVLRARGTRGRALIVGSNRDEYSAVAALQPEVADRVRRDYAGAVRSTLAELGRVLRPLPLEALTDEILALYPDPADPVLRIEQFSRTFGDLYGNCPALDLAAAVAMHGAEAYLYEFTRDLASPVPLLDDLGAFHSMELFYVFGDLAGLRDLGFDPDDADAALSRRMMAAWSGFARGDRPDADPPWPTWRRGTRLHYRWDADPDRGIANGYRDGRCAALGALLERLDRDGDLVADDADDCPATANASQLDTDGDGHGDACELAVCGAPALPRLAGAPKAAGHVAGAAGAGSISCRSQIVRQRRAFAPR